MAKVIERSENSKPPVTIELTGAEADALYSLLIGEKWPDRDEYARLLNGIYNELDITDNIESLADFLND